MHRFSLKGIEAQVSRGLFGVEEPDADSLAGRESETYSNRIHTCLITSSARRLLHSYRLVRELLEAFRDAIAGYRSLLKDGKMLHRYHYYCYFSRRRPKGRLIDMDLGKELNSLPSGASHWTGTMQFIAPEVL